MAGKSKIGFIGGGNMGEALIKGLTASEWTAPENVLVYDPSLERQSWLTGEYKVSAAKNNVSLVKAVSVIVLAVKPQVIHEVLEEIESAVRTDHLVISVAAGVTIGQIQAGLRASAPVVRVMPNTPALIGEGAAAMAPGAFAGADHLARARSIFETVGLTVEVEEKYLDVVTGLSGSGPAYVFVLLEALADGAVRMGLPRKEANLLAVQTVLGAARLALESGLHPGQLKDQVTSPGGTTAAGLFALESRGFRAAVQEAVAAATTRSKELGRK